MNPTHTASTNPEFFTLKKIEFFTENAIQNLEFKDAETAVHFISAVDAIVDSFVRRLEGEGVTYSEELLLQVGCALGEAFIMLFSGSWEYSEQQARWIVVYALPDADSTLIQLNVFHKIEKRFANGTEDSITYLFESLKNSYLQAHRENTTDEQS